MKLFFQFCSSFFCIVLSAGFFGGCVQQENNHNHNRKETLFIFQVDDVDSTFHLNGLNYHLRARLEDDSIKFRDSVFIPGFGRYIQRRDTLAVKKYPHGLTIIITSDTTKDTTIIKAGYARFQNINDKTFEFSDDVQLISKKYSLFTELLLWDVWRRKYVTDKNIRIVTPEEELTGSGFESDLTFSRFQINNMKGSTKLE
jgi:hypothetical protein